jgi:lysyl-tRNA synthetase class 1
VELGVKVEGYRMRDLYRSGEFNEPIDVILRNAEKVRRVYKEVSGSERPAHWLPFQVICEKCGCIGTTEVSDYDGHEVSYMCRADKVVNTKLNLGRGCGYEGKVSPFDGRGKLPWKLEWVAKWVRFPVTIEGAGKGSLDAGRLARCERGVLARDLWNRAAAARAVRIFPRGRCEDVVVERRRRERTRHGKSPAAEGTAFPDDPHEAEFAVNFDVREEGIVKLFNEFDRFHTRTEIEKNATPDEACVHRLSELTPEGGYMNANFQLVSALVQLPHLDPVKEIEKRKGVPLTAIERRHLDQRIASAKIWVENYASEEEKTRLQETLPARAQELTHTQRAFLHNLAAALPSIPWEDDALQSKIFEVARMTPVEQPVAFKAIYRVLLDREAGPKAGNLLAFLEREFVIARFRELAFDKIAFWRESAVTMDTLEKWIVKEGDKIASRDSQLCVEGGATANEMTFTLKDGKRLLKRVVVEGPLIA